MEQEEGAISFDQTGLVGLNGLRSQIDFIAREDGHVVITGEIGTGKRMIARVLHKLSGRSSQPFVSRNVQGADNDRFERLMFGDSDRQGYFSMAENGVLVLGEIDELSMEMQARLISVLEEESPPDVRLIATANRSLADLVEQQGFRQDLLYRLAKWEIDLLPLRRRPADLALLANHFVKKYGDGRIRDLPQDVTDYFLKYDWPGNVRELENVIYRMCRALLAEEKTNKEIVVSVKNAIVHAKLPVWHCEEKLDGVAAVMVGRETEFLLEHILACNSDAFRIIAGTKISVGSMANLAAILALLVANDGNVKRTARELGISRRTLHNIRIELPKKVARGDLPQVLIDFIRQHENLIYRSHAVAQEGGDE